MFSIGRNLYAGGGIFYDQFWNIKISDALGKHITHLLNRDLKSGERASGIALKLLLITD